MVKLGDLLEEFEKEETSKLFLDFTCPKNPDVEDFLRFKSIRFEESDSARTYLILNEEGLILAYFSISFKELYLGSFELAKTQVKKLDGMRKDVERLRVFLIGQLAKNYSVDDNALTLQGVLDEVYCVIDQVKSLIGGRAIILECENSQRLIELYEHHGFKVLNTREDAD
ncbi:acetyltransferase [Shewanella sp. YLB-07]|nr:acetyltransferase [Shewanella sp. YLB-07]